MLPATGPKQACRGPGFHIWHPAELRRVTQRAGQRLAPCPPSPFVALGVFLPQKQPPESWPAEAWSGGFPIRPASARQAPSSSCPSLILAAALPSSSPLSSLLQRSDQPAVGRVSNRMPSPFCLMRQLGWASPVLEERVDERERVPPHTTCTAGGLGQDVGKTSVSPVGTRGYPDPGPGIVSLGMTHLWGPWFPPFPAPHPDSTCPALPPPTPNGLGHGQGSTTFLGETPGRGLSGVLAGSKDAS